LSQAVTVSIRAFTEFTFQVAIFMVCVRIAGSL
jgi:hypothetical protein